MFIVFQFAALALTTWMGAGAALTTTIPAGWHLPVPAGEWVISRGPCGAATAYDHPCGYYEDRCAVDLVAPRGDTTYTPVLAPYTGTVGFVGRRTDAGLTVMLEHPNGWVSALMHLERAAVNLGDAVGRGAVIGYAGSTGTTRAHVHFHLQPNWVDRACLPPDGLDTLDWFYNRAESRNLPLNQLTLVNAPPPLLNRMGVARVVSHTVNLSATLGVVLDNPTMTSPASYSQHSLTPRLCWSYPQGGRGLRFRVHVVSGQSRTEVARSAWLTPTTGLCWQPPPLPTGVYFWKVMVQAANGQLNRTNQRPAAFILR